MKHPTKKTEKEVLGNGSSSSLELLKTCMICGKKYDPQNSDPTINFCSKQCLTEFMKG